MSTQEPKPLLPGGGSQPEGAPTHQARATNITNSDTQTLQDQDVKASANSEVTGFLPAPQSNHSKSKSYDSTYDIYHSAPSSPTKQAVKHTVPEVGEESTIMTPSLPIPEIRINGSTPTPSQNPYLIDLYSSNQEMDPRESPATPQTLTRALTNSKNSDSIPVTPQNPTKTQKQNRRISHEEHASTLPFTSHFNDSEAELQDDPTPNRLYKATNNEIGITRMGTVRVFPYPATVEADTRPFPARSSSLMDMDTNVDAEADLKESVERAFDGQYSDGTRSDIEESEDGHELQRATAMPKGKGKGKENAQERPLPPLPKNGVERGVNFAESSEPSRASSRFPIVGGRKGLKQEKWGKKERAIAWIKGHCHVM